MAEHWEQQERRARLDALDDQDAPCLLELRARVEALEATQHAHVDASRPGKWDHVKIPVETTYGVESTQAEQLMQSRTFTADEVAPIVTSAARAPASPGESEYTDAEWAEIQRWGKTDDSSPTPAGSLVERVYDAMVLAAAGSEARAAIREVAAWLRKGGDYDANAWASLLEQEADRG